MPPLWTRDVAGVEWIHPRHAHVCVSDDSGLSCINRKQLIEGRRRLRECRSMKLISGRRQVDLAMRSGGSTGATAAKRFSQSIRSPGKPRLRVNSADVADGDQCVLSNNVVEQDQRSVKQVRAMQGSRASIQRVGRFMVLRTHLSRLQAAHS